MRGFSSTFPCAETIKANNPISSIIGQHVDLKRCGSELRGCCPFHADRTPSFYVNEQKGQFHCFGCGAGGDVIEFVRKYYDMTFTEAFDAIRAGGFDGERTLTVEPSDKTDRSEIARKVWSGCCHIAGTLAADYLEKRGLPIEVTATQTALRYGKGSFDGSSQKHPMLVAAATNLEGEIVGIQRIFLDEAGNKLAPDCKRSLGTLRGAAVHIAREDGKPCDGKHIYLTEGLEDALSLSRIGGYIEVWASLGTGGLAHVELPAQCEKVTIAHDNDEAGRNAAAKAAERFVKQGLTVDLRPAPSSFKDWSEYLQYWEFTPPYRYYNELPWRMCLSQLERYIGFEEGYSDD